MTMLKIVLDFIGRYTLILSIIAVVLLTTASMEITKAVMIEIGGFAAMAILIANITLWAFSPKKFTNTDAQGAYNVQAAIIAGSFILVGLCVVGMYIAKSDGALASGSAGGPSPAARTIPYLIDSTWGH